jgi:hypothetical protein
MKDGIAYLCFFARVVSLIRDDPIQVEIWAARALSTAMLTGATHTAARLILAHSFKLNAKGAQPEARMVLDEILRLIGPDDFHQPRLRRLYYEKTGFSFFKERNYKLAIEYYQKALAYCEEGSRAKLKVQGGATLAGYMSLENVPANHLADRAASYIDIMCHILRAAESANFHDVVQSASCNIKLWSQNSVGSLFVNDFKPFWMQYFIMIVLRTFMDYVLFTFHFGLDPC